MSRNLNKGITVKYNKMIPLSEIPLLAEGDFRNAVLELTQEGWRCNAFFSMINKGSGSRLMMILSDDHQGVSRALCLKVENNTFRSLSTEDEQFHLFEREIYEQSGIMPGGHPWLKPVRFPRGQVESMDFFRMEGPDVHQVAVGPVHAGIIEPGHFRFQCHGETVYHLETSHGFQHRGIEKAIAAGPAKNTLLKIGVTAGDSTIAHTMAYCQIFETFTETRISARAEAIRAIALELERCANHIGDLGALSGDVGYLPTASYCGRIRGEFLNMSALLCGNRFGRNLVCPGGTSMDIDDGIKTELLKRLDAGKKDFLNAAALLWDSPSVLARFDATGTVSGETANRIGMVGPAARASGCQRDIRKDHPSGYYHLSFIPVSTAERGDVNSRAYVRWLEVQESIKFIEKLLKELPEGETLKTINKSLAPDSLAISFIEGWRGEVCHAAVTESSGRFKQYKIVDPSFHNWLGLSLALRGEEISDFPVCNKSFNLSYCGFDL
ncbi:MAG: hypothetical protein JEY99_13935 [Spirochaetales bacterium]|nr:hypothetical protein [Spirochaetales bacterium]